MTERLAHARTILTNQSCDGLIISSVPHIIWLTGYTGFSTIERECYLFITQTEAYLFTDLRYSNAVRTLVPHFQTKEIQGETTFPTQLETVVRNGRRGSIGFEADNLTVSEYTRLGKVISNLKTVDLTEIRMIKTADEIAAIQKACEIGDQTFAYIIPLLKPGMTEKFIANLMERFIQDQDASLSFSIIVASGSHASIPHHLTSDTPIQNNTVLLIDFGVQYKQYCSDMTRTVFLGKADERQKNIYETVRIAQQKAITYISRYGANPKATDADKAARDYISSQGFSSIPHSLGHGIGIEVHEAPSLSPHSLDILGEGMVFSIEPGIYLFEDMRVRIEDLFTIQDKKLVQLTHADSRLIELG